MKKRLNFKTKSLSVLSAAALLGSMVTNAYAATALTDIPNNYAREAILELVSKGIMNGTGNGKFSPASNITRQDFAIVLANALKLDVNSSPSSAAFKDVPATSYAFASVEAAVKAGIIKGMGGGLFGATQDITREQMAVMFVNALHLDVSNKNLNPLTFKDADQISGWAKPSVAAAIELGLMTGKPDGFFDPSHTASRQDVALVASKFLAEKKKMDEPELTPVPTPTPMPTPVPTPMPTPVPTPMPTPEPTPVPTPVPTPEPTPTPVPEPEPEQDENQAPVISNLKFVDDNKNEILSMVEVGTALNIEFDYQDAENDPPKIMHYKWYLSDDAEFANKELIDGVDINHYTPTESDIGKYIMVEVTPYAATGTEIGLAASKTLTVPVSALRTLTGKFGFDANDTLTAKEFTEGTLSKIRFDYYPMEGMTNGTIEVSIEGISFSVSDYYNLGEEWINFTEDQISNDGHTVTIENVNTASHNAVSFELGGSSDPVGKVIPAAGSYKITLKADADGTGVKLPAEEQTLTLISNPAVSEGE
ncbi:S-layer homology domain-containing protein [Paenibacillus sp. JX-17]|uniref:S-layer homology domain-containing protein n=1 Tax=Paenibacillus lacisoli TaxID=3064525 RepID=A0ABT9CDY7_9BACL|nr:S-layer homology domain-containing protein [Paenibacillus sp. JX-17]MDO7907489.1 S-layer homology domain-containing protein [Paenibacillus sp. JX-17]